MKLASPAESPGTYPAAAYPEDMAVDNQGNLVLLWSLDYDGLQLRLFNPQGTPQGPPVDASSDASEEPQRPRGGQPGLDGKLMACRLGGRHLSL